MLLKDFNLFQLDCKDFSFKKNLYPTDGNEVKEYYCIYPVDDGLHFLCVYKNLKPYKFFN